MRIAATFGLLCVVWMLWSGHTEPLLLGLGLASVLVVLWLSIKMDIIDSESFPFHVARGLLAFIPWVILQIIKSNLSVAKLILTPSLPIEPHLIRLKVRQRTELGQVIHANTITITPGTVTLDIRDDHFLVHALTKEFADEEGIGELDRRVARLEGQNIEVHPARARSIPPESPQSKEDS